MSSSTLGKVINIALYQLGWFSCILGPANGFPYAGAAGGIILLTIHLMLVVKRKEEIKLVALCCLLGMAIDTLQQGLGLFTFAVESSWPFHLPLWIVVIWSLFSTILRFSLFWLRGRYLLAALLGALGGPLAYSSGISLGVAHFGDNPQLTIIVLAVVWALILPLLLWISQKLDPEEGHYRIAMEGKR